MNPDDLIAERQKTHGDFRINSRVAQTIRYACREAPGWASLTFVQREALDHIAGKIGRIVASDGRHPDHFADIGGYARLGELDAQTQRNAPQQQSTQPGGITWVSRLVP